MLARRLRLSAASPSVPAMTTDVLAYLRSRGESQNALARRAGVDQRTVNRAARGLGCSLETALRLVRASRALPGPAGETIGWEELAQSQRGEPGAGPDVPAAAAL